MMFSIVLNTLCRDFRSATVKLQSLWVNPVGDPQQEIPCWIHHERVWGLMTLLKRDRHKNEKKNKNIHTHRRHQQSCREFVVIRADACVDLLETKNVSN